MFENMYRKKKTAGEEKKYQLVGNLKFNMLSAYKWDKCLLYFQFLIIVPNLLSNYAGVLLPAKLVESLESRQSISQIILTVLILIFGMWLCDTLAKAMHSYMYRNSLTLSLYYDKLCFRKIMRLDYAAMEEPENQMLIKNVWNVIRNEFTIRNSVTSMPALLVSIVSTLWYGILLFLMNPLIIFIEVACIFVGYHMLLKSKKIYKEKSKEVGPFAKEAAYINRQSMDRAAGKDIRIFGMQDLFLAKYNHAINGMNKIYDSIHNSYIRQNFVTNISVFLSYIIPHGYLLYLLTVQNTLTVADFVLYSGLLTQFSAQFYSMLSYIRDINPISTSIEHIRRFLELEENGNNKAGIGQEKFSEMMQSGLKIEFINLSYTYPGKKEATLKNINLTIHPNEKLALIGLNGAGKTTLVKLLCGFYQPTEGKILINGIPSEQFSMKEQEQLVSALFQDSTVIPLSLDENLTGAEKGSFDEAYLKKTLEISGFKGRYEKLSRKGDTLLVKEANENATDFSGGEKQKLFFARALYKKAPMLILDEPTAALDPIAENELYQKYSEAVKNRTSIFISHRLSSTRFCDRIVLLEDSIIKEEGTHEALMRKGGRYAELYELQSKYYKENGKELTNE